MASVPSIGKPPAADDSRNRGLCGRLWEATLESGWLPSQICEVTPTELTRGFGIGGEHKFMRGLRGRRARGWQRQSEEARPVPTLPSQSRETSTGLRPT